MASEEEIANFCAITDTSPEEAQTYLQLADGDLQQAITLYMEGGLGPNISQAAQTPTPTTEPQHSTMTDEELARQLQADDHVRAPIAPKHDILAGGGGPSTSWTPRERVVPPLRSSIFNQGDSASGSMSDFMSRLNPQTPPSGGSPLTGSPDLGNNSPGSKAKRLADLFRPPFDIMFHGTFEEAREEAKEKNKWLLINIQDQTEFACQVLNRDLWSDSFIKDIIKASFIFLQYANTSPDGQRYRTYYQIMNFPHIAVIDARTGERVKMWEKEMKPTDFMMEVTEFLEHHEGTPSTMKRPRKMKEVTEMTEEEQLNAAIAASLGSPSKETTTTPASTSREFEMDTPMETTPPQQESTQQQTQPPPEKEEEEEKAGSLFDSIKPVKREETKDMANSTRVQLRMPDGKRLVRRLLKTDPVLYLFEYIKAEVPEAASQPFELVFNRTQLIDVLDQSIAEAGLTNAAVNCVFV